MLLALSDSPTPPMTQYGYLRFTTGDPDDDRIAAGVEGEEKEEEEMAIHGPQFLVLPTDAIPRDCCSLCLSRGFTKR